MNTSLKRLIASIMLVTLTVAPTYAACGPDGCVSPCNYEELLYDTRFSGNCPQWVWNANAHRVKIGTNWMAELTGPGSVSQSVTTGSYSGMSVAYSVTVTTTTAGTERLYVDILRGNFLLDTLEVIYPDSGGSEFNMAIDNYSNDNIKIRFRYIAGTAPGDSVFRVDNVAMFGTFI